MLLMSSFPSELYDRLQMLVFWNKKSGGMHLNPTFVLTDIPHGRRGISAPTMLLLNTVSVSCCYHMLSHNDVWQVLIYL